MEHADDEDCVLPLDNSFMSLSSLKKEEFLLIKGGVGMETLGLVKELQLLPKCAPALFKFLEFNELVRLNGSFLILPCSLDQSDDIILSLAGDVRERTDLLALLANFDLSVTSSMPSEMIASIKRMDEFYLKKSIGN